jgi:hypothetical protein
MLSLDSSEEIAGERKQTAKHCTVWEKDAYNVFRSLCKLSMKPFKEPAASRFAQSFQMEKIQNFNPIFIFLNQSINQGTWMNFHLLCLKKNSVMH